MWTASRTSPRDQRAEQEVGPYEKLASKSRDTNVLVNESPSFLVSESRKSDWCTFRHLEAAEGPKSSMQKIRET